jgi:hypothetical protein
VAGTISQAAKWPGLYPREQSGRDYIPRSKVAGTISQGAKWPGLYPGSKVSREQSGRGMTVTANLQLVPKFQRVLRCKSFTQSNEKRSITQRLKKMKMRERKMPLESKKFKLENYNSVA